MAEFIRLPNLVVNLSLIREIYFAGDELELHWANGETTYLSSCDAGVLLEILERRYGLMTDPAARLMDLEDEASLQPA